MDRFFWIFCILVTVVSFRSVEAETQDSTGTEPVLRLVGEGRPGSVIVLPDQPTPVVLYAAKELQYHIQQASGATLPILREDEFQGNGAAIFLGPTQALKRSGLAPDFETLKVNIGDFWVSGAAPQEGLSRLGWRGASQGGNLYFFGADTDKNIIPSTSGAAGTLFAVYDFLEQQLGIRWIWPGKIGEHIPLQETIEVSKYDVAGQPRFRNSAWRTGKEGRYTLKTPLGWKSREARKKFHDDQEQWLLRQRFRNLSRIVSNHAFEDYWERYKDVHPGIFARLPNGKRERLPGDRRDGIDMSLCLSNPTLHSLVVKDWAVRAEAVSRWADPKVVNAVGNDVAERCTCDVCRAWDAPDDRFQKHPYWTQGEIRKEFRFMTDGPSLTDRYARFAQAVLQEAQANFRPDAEVVFLAYANYSEPPKETKLDERFTVGIVTWPGVSPWGQRTPGDLTPLKSHWGGWKETGANLYLRPNTFHTGWNMPVYYADRIGDAFSYCAQQGMVDADFDALMGQWATQAPNYYMLGRKHARPDLPTENVLNEFYDAFGTAKNDIRDYFKHWEQVCSDVTTTSREGMLAEHAGILEGTGVSYWGWTDSVFTSEHFEKGRLLLEKAKSSAADDTLVQSRIEVLSLGLELSEKMTVVVSALKQLEEHRSPEKREQLEKTFQEMKAFRERHEERLLTNVGYLYLYGDREFEKRIGLALAQDLVLPVAETLEILPVDWKFRKDPKDHGRSRQWQSQAVDSQWQDIRIDEVWTRQDAGRDHRGVAWYALSWKVPPEVSDRIRKSDISGNTRRLALQFEAVDGFAEIFLNGRKIGSQELSGEFMWDQPFTILLPSDFDPDRVHDLRVRVKKAHSAAGIWKPVSLVVAEVSS